jgi:hypothetical protein
MAKLTVQATYQWRAFQLESKKTPVVVSISVTDDAGNPVEGLSENQVKVQILFGPIIGGEWGESWGPVELAQVGDALNGFYNVGVKPGLALAWGAGHYVVGLIVEKKTLRGGIGAPVVTDRGQTVAAFDVA